jgi:putative DNA primase/helicase
MTLTGFGSRWSGWKKKETNSVTHRWDEEINKKQSKGGAKMMGSLWVEEFDELEPESVEWMWPGKYAYGKLGLLGGMPSTGKSTILMSMIAILTRGGTWPFTTIKTEPGDAIIMSTEDGSRDTLVPRLMASGADRKRVKRIRSCVNLEDAGLKSISFATDMDRLYEAVQIWPETRLIAFDPLSAYLGAKNSHSDADVREVLEPLTRFAEETNVCLIGVAHLSKAGGGLDAMHHFAGAHGIVGQSRTAYMTIQKDGINYMAWVKNNLECDEDSKGLTYRLQTEYVADNKGAQIKTSAVEWTGVCEEKANELRAALAQQGNQPKRNEAESWLKGMLKDGPKSPKALEEAADKMNIAWRTVERLKDRNIYVAHKPGFNSGWMWYSIKDYDDLMEQKRMYKEKAKG